MAMTLRLTDEETELLRRTAEGMRALAAFTPAVVPQVVQLGKRVTNAQIGMAHRGKHQAHHFAITDSSGHGLFPQLCVCGGLDLGQ